MAGGRPPLGDRAMTHGERRARRSARLVASEARAERLATEMRFVLSGAEDALRHGIRLYSDDDLARFRAALAADPPR